MATRPINVGDDKLLKRLIEFHGPDGRADDYGRES
jgi:hypothetical protein